jgi:hypothetical protein
MWVKRLNELEIWQKNGNVKEIENMEKINE